MASELTETVEEKKLIEKIQSLYPKSYASIVKAYQFAKMAHAGQKRESGEEYIIHPICVANILMDLNMDEATVSAALLHDVVEDTQYSEEDIVAQFGEEVAELVQGVTKLDKLQIASKEEDQAENFRKMFFAMAKDIRIIFIKLADRLHNMRSLSYLPENRRKAIARETLDIYAPLAGRLGISQIKCELDDLSLRYLEPESYYALVEKVNLKRSERQEYVNRMVAEIKEKLQEYGIQAEVFGRPKHLYSIYKKMKTHNVAFEQIYDLFAVRVIVQEEKDCYNVLGIIHTFWRPLPGRFKDYISTPKPNNYQSLHTTVMTSYGIPFEIQIRTAAMHRIAEFGIASHWKYKEERTKQSDLDTKLSWLRQALELESDFKDSKEFLDTLKTDLYSSEAVVFTPKGDVISLPAGSTPIDFAYHIHSAIGNKMVGAKVNSKMVPLTYQLKTGDIVDIVTSQNSKGPSRDWLKYVKTTAARAKIHSFFKKEMKEENIKKGKEMLENEAKRRGYNLHMLLQPKWLDIIMQRYNISSLDDMYASVGYGGFTTNQILFKLIDFYRQEEATPTPEKQMSEAKPLSVKQGVLIKGYEGFLVRLARCCNPVPGDEIVGYISRGRGVAVHRKDCSNLKNAEPERLIEASWTNAPASGAAYDINIQIEAMDKEGLLANITTLISSLKFPIISVNARLIKGGKALLNFTIRINRVGDMDILLNKISGHPDVINVYRTST